MCPAQPGKSRNSTPGHPRTHEAAHQARERAAGLSAALTAMLGATDPKELGEIVLAEAHKLPWALTGNFTVRDQVDDSLVSSAFFGYPEADTALVRRMPGSAASAVNAAMRAGTTIVLDKEEYRALFPELADAFLRAGNQAVISVPLATKGRVVGGFSIGFAREDAIHQAERTFLESLATAAATTIERLSAFEAERRHREEATALARVTRALIEAETIEEVGELAWKEAAALLGALRGAFFVVDQAAAELVLVDRSGFSETLRARMARVQLSLPMAATDAVRSGQVVAIEDPDAYEARYPRLIDQIFGSLDSDPPPAASLVVPVKGREEVLGSLGFGFSQPRKLTERDVWLAQSFADAAASAITRLRFIEAERAARGRSEALARTFATLFDASDPSTVGTILLAEAKATTHASDGVVALLDGTAGYFNSIATLGDSINTSARRPITEQSALGEAMLTGATLTIEGPDEYARRYPEYADIVRKGEVGAVAAMPLVAHGRVVGGFVVGYVDRDRLASEVLEYLASIGRSAAEAIQRLRAQRLLEAVVSQMPIGVIVADPKGRFVATNPMLHELWRGVASWDSIDDYTKWSGFHPNGSPFAAEDWPLARSLQRGETILDEAIEVQRFDGSRGVFEVSSAPIRDEQGSTIAAAAVFADATGRVEAERAQEAFLAVLSHELRTPITSIMLAGHRLRNRGEAMSASTRHGLYVDIEAEAERLNRVVGNLLVLSRVERGGALEAGEPILLQRILPAIVSAEAKLWPGVKYRLECSPGLPVIQAEPVYVEQIVRNLLANAAKYAGGVVDVSVVAIDHELRLRVSDRGPGIPSEERERVFELFYRVPGATKTAVGAGIGLFVVRSLVQAMNGRVWVEESGDGGACFTVALRAIPAEAGQD